MRCSCGDCPDSIPLDHAGRRREAWFFLAAMALVILGAFLAAVTSGCRSVGATTVIRSEWR